MAVGWLGTHATVCVRQHIRVARSGSTAQRCAKTSMVASRHEADTGREPCERCRAALRTTRHPAKSQKEVEIVGGEHTLVQAAGLVLVGKVLVQFALRSAVGHLQHPRRRIVPVPDVVHALDGLFASQGSKSRIL